MRGAASAVMVRNEELWIGLLVFDPEGATRMRYYTNVEAWKKQVPKTIDASHDTLHKGIPIDLMS